MIVVLFYALEYKADPAKQGVVRMCVFVLQTLSTEPSFGRRLNKIFDGQDYLPTSIRLANFNGTYADFLITVNLPSYCKRFQLTILVRTHAHHHR